MTTTTTRAIRLGFLVAGMAVVLSACSLTYSFGVHRSESGALVLDLPVCPGESWRAIRIEDHSGLRDTAGPVAPPVASDAPVIWHVRYSEPRADSVFSFDGTVEDSEGDQGVETLVPLSLDELEEYAGAQLRAVVEMTSGWERDRFFDLDSLPTTAEYRAPAADGGPSTEEEIGRWNERFCDDSSGLPPVLATMVDWAVPAFAAALLVGGAVVILVVRRDRRRLS